MAEKPEDLSLPASVVARIIKDALPEGVSISKEARIAIGKAASVFILYCTACSNNFALQAKRKTLAASDVLSALSDMEFEQFLPELKSFLEAYKQEQKGKRVAAADRRKQKAVAQALASEPSTSSTSVGAQQATSSVSESGGQATGGGEGESSGGEVLGSAEEGVGGGGGEEESMETDPAPPEGGGGEKCRNIEE